MGKISKICARVGKCFKKYFSIPLFTGMLLLGIQQSYFPAHAVETQTFNITYSGNKIQGESVWYQGHWSHNTSDLFWIEKVSTANNGDVTYRIYAGLRCHGYGSNHNAWGGIYQINLNGRTFNIGPNGKWWDRDIAGNGCWKNGGGNTFKTTLKAGQTYNISVYVKNPDGATASQWSGRISIPQVAYYQNIQARYQNADGTWGNYSSVKSGNANYNTTYSWSRAADGTYKAASISYTVTQANTKYVDVYRQVYTDYIDHWMWGFTKGEGNNGDKRAWKIKTTSFTKRAGQGYTLATGDAVRVPNGFSLANTFGTASINGKWSSFNLGYSGSQPGGNMYIEFDYSPVSYKINYNMNGGTNANSNPSTYNVLYGVNFATPTRPGYNFLGWYINDTKVSGINVGANASFSSESDMYNKLSSRTTGDKTVEARWEKNSYTISIDPNGGSYNGSTDVTKINQAPGKSVEINQIPTRSGYTFIGWKRSGSGSLHSGHSYNQSGITQYEKADSDGTAYTNYKMNFDNTTSTGYAYPCIQYFSYGYTSGHTYRLSVDVRVNKSSNNEYAHIRHSAFVNNWVAPSTTVNYLTNGWEHRTIERTFTGTTSEQSGTNYNIYPFVEFYAGIAGGKRGVLDFDMKNLTIYDVTAGKYVTSNHNSIKNGATVDVGKGDTTITAVWIPNNTITYKAGNGGSVSRTSETVEGYKDALGSSASASNGYHFDGWYASGTKISSNSTWIPGNPNNSHDNPLQGGYYGGTISSFDRSTNTYTINAKASDMNSSWGTGVSAGINNNDIIPWNKYFTATFDVWSPIDAKIQVDINNQTVDGVNASGNDNDVNRGGTTAISLKANTWTTVSFWYQNACSTNSSQAALRNYSGIGLIWDTSKGDQTFKIRNYQTMVSNNVVGSAREYEARFAPNSYQQTIRVRFENADGSFTNYSQAYQANHNYDSIFEWEFPESQQYQSAKVSYKVTGDKSTDVTVYRKKYTLTITGDDGVESVSGTGSFRYGSTASVSYKLKTGYKFVKSTGTNTDGSQNGSWTGLAGKEGTIQDTWNITCNRTIKVYTELINYSISYDLNGGSMSGQKTSYNVNSATFTLPMPSKTGYTFTGWTGSNGGTPQKSVTISKGSTGNKSYTANWSINTYSISYNLNGGSMSGQKTSYDVTTESFTLPTPTRTGYTFTGWTGSNGSTPQKSVTIAKGSTGNKSYTANWSINSYTLTVNPNGGSWNGSSSSQNIVQNFNTTKSIPVPTRTGYTFLRWDLNGSGTLNNRITSDPYFTSGMGGISTYNNNGDGKVVLIRQAKSSDNTFGSNYEIKIDVKGANNPGYGGFYHGIASVANTKYVHSFIAKLPKGTTLAIAHNPVGDDYSKRWLTSNEGTGKWELYAYEMNTGSKGTFSTFGHIYVSSSSTSAFTWYLAASQITTVSSNATYTYGAGNGTLVAQWAPNRYTVTYNSNKGSGSMNPDTVTYNTAYKTKKNTFTRTGYTFNGWNEKADGTGTAWALTSSGVYEANKTWTWTYTHNITLYAQWKPNNYTYNIKYVSSSGKSLGNDTVTGTFDTSKTVTPPAKTGYTTPAAQTVKFDSTGAKTIIFTYQLINYSISYDVNGGTALSGQRTSYNIESSAYTLPVPSRTGYKFTGWTGSNGTTPQKSVTIAAGSTGNKSYKANWTANSLTIHYHSNGAFGGNAVKNGKWENNVVLDYEQSKDIIVSTERYEEGTSNNGLKQYGLADYDGKMNDHVYLYKNGYLGTGKYNTKPNGSGIEIDENKTFNSVIELANYLGVSIDSKDNSIDLYPQWKAISYSIVYNGNGATSGNMTEQPATFDRNIELASNSFSRKYTVTYNAMGGTVNAPNNVASATFNGWEDRGNISFMDNNYTYNDFDAPYYSQNYTDLNAAYDFNKYNLIKHYFLYGKSEGRNPKDTTGKVGLYPNKAAVKNMTITNGYKVNLYANWKLGSVTLPTPTRFGYKFLGWYTSAEGGTKITGATYTPTSNVTLYAHWKLDSYYIDYKVNDTGLTDRITDNLPDNNGSLPGKDTAVMLTDFALQNGSKYNTKYTFKEWNTKPDGSGQKFTTSITNDGSLCKPGETLTLYAIWDATPAMSAKDFYLIENIAVQNDIVTTGAGYDKTPTEKYPEKLSEVKYPIKGLTKNGTDISNKIKVDYIEYDNKTVGSIDVSKVGKYIVHYSLIDGYNTKKFTRNITVLPASTPVINAGDRYFKKNAFISADILKDTVSANDKYDGDLIAKTEIKDVDKINVGEEGAYQITYSIKNSSNKTANKKVNIYIIDYLPDNSADVSNSYRFVRKDCSEANDYCLQYFNEDSKWNTDSNLKEFLMNSLSKTDDSKPVKKYSFKSDDVAKSKKK